MAGPGPEAALPHGSFMAAVSLQEGTVLGPVRPAGAWGAEHRARRGSRPGGRVSWGLLLRPPPLALLPLPVACSVSLHLVQFLSFSYISPWHVRRLGVLRDSAPRNGE